MRSGWKSSSASHFSPVPISLMGLPRHRAHGERRAAAAVAVDAGEHDAGDADALVEALGELHRVLAGEAVGDQQRLVRTGDVAHLGRLAHQVVVDVRAPGGVEQHHVVAGEPGRPPARGA